MASLSGKLIHLFALACVMRALCIADPGVHCGPGHEHGQPQPLTCRP